MTWDDFSAGEYGGEDPRKWPKGAWSGTNVVRYLDGSIGPRAGFRVAHTIEVAASVSAFSVLPAARSKVAAVPGPTGGLRDGGIWVQIPNNIEQIVANWWNWKGPVWYFLSSDPPGTDVDISGAPGPRIGDHLLASDLGALEQTPLYAEIISSRAEGAPYAHTDPPRFGGSYVWSDTAVTLIDPNLGRHLAFYGERLVGSVLLTVQSSFNQLQFGPPGDYTPGSVDTTVDVGTAGFEIVCIRPQRGHLAVGKEDGTWWVMTGPPDSGALRHITTGFPVPRTTPFTQSADGTVWWYDFDHRCPVSFDGSSIRVEARVRLPDAPSFFRPHCRGVQHWLGDAALMMNTGGVTRASTDETWILHQRGGRWYRHVLSLHSTHFGVDGIAALPNRLVISRTRYVSGTTTGYVLVQEEVERPPFANGASGALQWEDSYDDGVAFVTELDLPQHWDPDNDVELRGVTVDFKKFSTGDSRTNHFDITVEAHGRRDAGVLASTQTFSFDQATAGGVSGTDESRTFWFGDQAQGRGSQAHLSNLRGVALRGVTAHYEPAGSV